MQTSNLTSSQFQTVADLNSAVVAELDGKIAFIAQRQEVETEAKITFGLREQRFGQQQSQKTGVVRRF